MRRITIIALLCLCAGFLAAQSEADGFILWIDQGMGYGGPDRAGFLIEEGLFGQYKDGNLSLVGALDLDWRLLDGLALPLQLGAGWLVARSDYFYHSIFALAGWDFVTGRFCWQAHWRMLGPLACYGTLGWDRGLRLLFGVSFGFKLS